MYDGGDDDDDHSLRLGVSKYDLYCNDTRNSGTSTNGFDFHGRLMTVYIGIFNDAKLCIHLMVVCPMWQS